MAGLVAPSVPSNGASTPGGTITQNSGQGGWDYNGQNYGNLGQAMSAYNSAQPGQSGQSGQATGNPQTTGGSTPAQQGGSPFANGQTAYSGMDQTAQGLYNQFQQYNGAPSSQETGGIQNQVQNFVNNMMQKAQGTYNSAVQHAQSNQQYSDQTALNAYNKGQQGLQTDSFLGYLKGQNGLADRGVAGTGGAGEDLNARTSLEYQRQLSGLLSNYQTALNQAQQQYGDSAYSAQQAMNNVDPTQQATSMYQSLMNSLMDQRGRQAQAAASMFNDYLTNQRTAQYNQGQMENMAAQRQQDALKTMLQYSMADGNHQYDGQVSRENNQDTNRTKMFGDLMNYDQTNPLTGEMTGTGKLDWAKLYEKAGYDKGMVQNGAQRNTITANHNAAMEKIDWAKVAQSSKNEQDLNSYRQTTILQNAQKIAQTGNTEAAKVYMSEASQINQQIAQVMTTARQEANNNSGQISDATKTQLDSLQTQFQNLQRKALPSDPADYSQDAQGWAWDMPSKTNTNFPQIP